LNFNITKIRVKDDHDSYLYLFFVEARILTELWTHSNQQMSLGAVLLRENKDDQARLELLYCEAILVQTVIR